MQWLYTILCWYLANFICSTGILLKVLFLYLVLFLFYTYIYCMIPVLLACLLMGLWVILTCSCIACFLWTIFWSRIIYRYICQFDLKSCPWYVQYMLWIHVLNLGFLAYFGLDTNSQYNASPYLLLFLQSSSNIKKNVYIWNSHIIKYCRMKKLHLNL